MHSTQRKIQLSLPIAHCDLIDRPLLPYFGSQFEIVPWLAQHSPREVKTYAELCGGGGSFLLRRQIASEDEIYSELNPAIVNLFQEVRDRPNALVGEILDRAANPNCFEWARAKVFRESWHDGTTAAAAYYLHSWLSYGRAGTRWSSGPSTKSKTVNPDHLLPTSRRLANVKILNADLFDTVEELDRPHCFGFIDPPFLWDCRLSKDNRQANAKTPRCQYDYEFASHTEIRANEGYEVQLEAHVRLAKLLRASPARIMICGYPTDLYKQLYEDHGWRREVTMISDMKGQERPQAIWMNYPEELERGIE